MGVFDRLGFNYDSTKFGSGNDLTDGQKLYLDGQTQLKTWQIDDLANSSVSGYFQNPHTANLATLKVLANSIMAYANTANANVSFSDTTTSNVANILFAAANTLYNEIPTFSAHVDRISGVTTSSTKSTVSDYSIAMAVGRQILSITNQTDSIQNNTPILGNFTSLTIGPDIANSVTTLTNDLNGLNAELRNNFLFKNIDAGYYHSLAIQSNGTLWTWGNNSYGGLGLGDIIARSSPIQVGTLSTWTQIAGGENYSLAVKSDGTLWAWGNNNNGQLGIGNFAGSRSSPVQVGSASTWTQVSCGYKHTLGYQSNGTLWAWGDGGFGELGIGIAGFRSTPTQIGFTPGEWTTLFSAGSRISMAIQPNGTLWSWGSNNYGQLGLNDLVSRSSPVQIGALSTWTKIACGDFHTLAIQSNGTLWAWGWGQYGGLGNPNILESTPTQIGALSTWTQITSGYFYSLAIQSNGTLWAWGYNNQGQLGLSNLTDRSSPVQVGALSVWTKISCSGGLTLALQSNGTLWAWGRNNDGQLGLNTSISYSSPVQVANYVYYNVTSSNSMNTFILDVQTAYSLLSQRRQGDTNFYVNSLSVLNDYQTLAQFNNLGVTQNYLIDNYIGTTKLKTNLAS